MSKRTILAFLALLVLTGGCSSADDGATVTAGGSVPDAPVAEAPVDSTTTTAASPPASTSSTTTTTTVATTTPTTTAPARTTSTTKPAPTTTTTTFPAGAVRLTIANDHPKPVDLTVNGVSYTLAAGQHLGPVPVIPAADHNDTYSAVVHGTNCGLGDGGPHFQEGHGTSVTMRLIPQGSCEPAGPGVPNLSLVFEGDWSGGH